jgi:hypothetical protein
MKQVGGDDGRYPVDLSILFMRLAMTRLASSCGIEQSTTEFAAQRDIWWGWGTPVGIVAVMSYLIPLIYLAYALSLEFVCQGDDYSRDIIISAQLG